MTKTGNSITALDEFYGYYGHKVKQGKISALTGIEKLAIKMFIEFVDEHPTYFIGQWHKAKE